MHSSAELTAALGAARPGSTIVLAPGTYQGRFTLGVSGTASAPLTVCGPRTAVVHGEGVKDGYVLHLADVSWVRVLGFTVENGQKGVMADHTSHSVIAGLEVRHIGDEAIHLRAFSSDDVVRDNVVHDTGLRREKFGEGIYVGTANSNWCTNSDCRPDASDRNVIVGNTIYETTAEPIDIKEGTTGGRLERNRLSGAGLTKAGGSAWVNVKGNDWTITGNVGNDSPKDGFQVHQVYRGWGYRNVFRANTANVNGPGYGYYSQSKDLMTAIGCDNEVVGAKSGPWNQPCVP